MMCCLLQTLFSVCSIVSLIWNTLFRNWFSLAHCFWYFGWKMHSIIIDFFVFFCYVVFISHILFFRHCFCYSMTLGIVLVFVMHRPVPLSFFLLFCGCMFFSYWFKLDVCFMFCFWLFFQPSRLWVKFKWSNWATKYKIKKCGYIRPTFDLCMLFVCVRFNTLNNLTSSNKELKERETKIPVSDAAYE